MNHIEGLDYHALIEDKIFMEVYHEGKKIAFHCGGGKGRTGTVAAGHYLLWGKMLANYK
ncbi:hypothetical protein [Paenibacillus ehimensis]|uniref:phosphatase domain-containing protein n=1 Tax=Paenibacillus ehimensis TaxID=79264 RepID=UPI003D2C8ADB